MSKTLTPSIVRDYNFLTLRQYSALRAENEALKQQVEQGKRDAVPEGDCATCMHAGTKDFMEPCQSCFVEKYVYQNFAAAPNDMKQEK